MYRSYDKQFRLLRSFPRTRGDVPYWLYKTFMVSTFPPHTRGCTAGEILSLPSAIVSPAHAGMYRSDEPEPIRPHRFPRTRGDVPRPLVASPKCRRFPRTRGMYHDRVPNASGGDGFPRTRGDVPDLDLDALKALEFPPHTRGCTRSILQESSHGRVSPAHAGMYRPQCSGMFLSSRFPPHTRGCTAGKRLGCGRAGVSPAHAGMYRADQWVEAIRIRFPRTRGIGRALKGPGQPRGRGCWGSAQIGVEIQHKAWAVPSGLSRQPGPILRVSMKW